MARVAIARARNPSEGVRRTISLLGGMERFVKKGETVLVKPNWVYLPPNLTTDPHFVGEVVRLCKEVGARVQVGDIPAIGATSRWIYEESGWGRIVEEAGAELVPLDEAERVKLSIPGGKVLKEVELPKPVVDADLFLDAPVAKTHVAAVVSLGIKNLVGILSDEYKYVHHRDDLHQKLADLLKVIKPGLTVIDGIVAGEGQGPANVERVNWGVVIAGDEVVATDAVGARAMGYDPQEVHSVRIAAAEGIGEADLSKIEILGEPLASVERRFKRAILNPTGFYPFDVFTSGWCDGCRAWMGACLDGWAKDGTFRKIAERKKVTIGVGCRVEIPDIEDRIRQGPVIVFGDCAPDETKKHPGVIHIPGCPPTVNLIPDFEGALRKYGVSIEEIQKEKYV